MRVFRKESRRLADFGRQCIGLAILGVVLDDLAFFHFGAAHSTFDLGIHAGEAREFTLVELIRGIGFFHPRRKKTDSRNRFRIKVSKMQILDTAAIRMMMNVVVVLMFRIGY